MAPSGTSCRCAVAPSSLFSPHHGAMLVEHEHSSPLVAHYASAAGAQYFQGSDLEDATPEQLADLFVQRFADVVKAGEGTDTAYGEWCAQMLVLTDPPGSPTQWPTGTSLMIACGRSHCSERRPRAFPCCPGGLDRFGP
jgi:hypothetical protein